MGNEFGGGFDQVHHGELEKELFFPLAVVELLLID